MSSDEQPANTSSDDSQVVAKPIDDGRPRYHYSVDTMLKLRRSHLVKAPTLLNEPPKPLSKEAKEAALPNTPGSASFQDTVTRNGRDAQRSSTRRRHAYQDANGNWQNSGHGTREHGGRPHRDWKDSNIDDDGAEPSWDDPNEPMILNEGYSNEIASFENWKREQARKRGVTVHTEPAVETDLEAKADSNNNETFGSNESPPSEPQRLASPDQSKPRDYKLDIWGSSEPASGEQGASRFSQLFGKDQAGKQPIPGLSPSQPQAASASQAASAMSPPPMGLMGNGLPSQMSQPPGLFSNFGAPAPKFQAPPGFSSPPGLQRPTGQFSGAPGQFPPGFGGLPPGFGGQPNIMPAGMPSGMPPGLGRPQNLQPRPNNTNQGTGNAVSDDDFFMSMLSKPETRS